MIALKIIRDIKQTREHVLFYPATMANMRAIKVAHVYYYNRQHFVRVAKIGKYLAINSLRNQ